MAIKKGIYGVFHLFCNNVKIFWFVKEVGMCRPINRETKLSDYVITDIKNQNKIYLFNIPLPSTL